MRPLLEAEPRLSDQLVMSGSRQTRFCASHLGLRRLRLALLAMVLAMLAYPAAASASELVARDVKDVRLAVDRQGRALVTYRNAQGIQRVLVWGAINADIKVRKDYSGGWKAFGRPVWKNFRDASRPYDGPELPWLVVARRAPDGSYWALQSWQRMLPNLGYEPWKRLQSAWELHISHWRGPLPKLEIWLDWVQRGRFEHLFGRFTYLGEPVFGFESTPIGAPQDPYGRNIYLDTFDSAYGPGWKRENSFLTLRPNGNFCYGFYPHEPHPGYPAGPVRPPGTGSRYRATVMGPGIAPVVQWQADALGPFDSDLDARMNQLGDEIAAGAPRCHRH